MGSQYIGFRLPDEYLAQLMSHAKPEESPSQAAKRLFCRKLRELETEIDGAPLRGRLQVLDWRLAQIEERLEQMDELPMPTEMHRLNSLLDKLDKRFEQLEKPQIKQRKKGFG